jgi:pyrroline-5-carboxylate reductase
MSSIVFIGGGNMASCIIGGMISQGFESTDIMVSVPTQNSRDRLKSEFKVQVTDDNRSAVASADVVILAVKPQIMRSVALDMSSAIPAKAVVVSIAAGISIESMQAWLGDSIAIVRAMPNTPSLVGTGATGLYANPTTDDAQQQIVSKIFEAVGYCCWVDTEAQINAVIAMSGSGPAYFFRILEIMQLVGQELGLSEDIARQLASQTALGAAKMAKNSDLSPAQLREQVTSPGGTTERALNTFQQEDLEAIFRKAMTSAVARAEQMSKDFSE